MLAEFETFNVICAEDRASATIDLEHDRADVAAGNRLALPLRVLWGDHWSVGQCFDVLALLRQRASNVAGHGMPCGHYIAQESPAGLLQEAMEFFRRDL